MRRERRSPAANAPSTIARSAAVARPGAHCGSQVDHAAVSVPSTMLTDYHVHLRADDDDRPAGARGVHGRERRPLPGGRRRRRGSSELGCSEHVYRFSAALEIWRHPFWEEQARDDLDAYCEFVRTTPLRLGLEVDFVPGAEDRTANLLDGHDLDYVLGSVHFIGDRAVDHEGWDIWETRRRSRRGVAPLLRGPGRGGPQRAVRHPRASRPGQGVGPGAPPPRARPALLLRAGGGGDRRGRGRGRGVDRGAAKAGRGALPGAGVRGDVHRRGGVVRALVRRPCRRATSATPTSARSTRCGTGGSSEIATFERRRRTMEPLG